MSLDSRRSRLKPASSRARSALTCSTTTAISSGGVVTSIARAEGGHVERPHLTGQPVQ